MTRGGFTTIFMLLGFKGGVDGGVKSWELTSETNGNADELRALNFLSNNSEGSGILFTVIDDWGEFKI